MMGTGDADTLAFQRSSYPSVAIDNFGIAEQLSKKLRSLVSTLESPVVRKCLVSAPCQSLRIEIENSTATNLRIEAAGYIDSRYVVWIAFERQGRIVRIGIVGSRR